MIPRSLAYVHARPCHFREESAQLGHARNCAEYLSLVALLLRCEPGVVLRASFLFSYFLSLVMFGILVAGAFRCWILSWRASFLGTLSARVLGTVLWCPQVVSPLVASRMMPSTNAQTSGRRADMCVWITRRWHGQRSSTPSISTSR